MGMKISRGEFINELDKTEDNLDKKIGALLDNANGLTSFKLHEEYHLPTTDPVAKIAAKKIRMTHAAEISSKAEHKMSKHDATLFTMGECVEKGLCSAKEFVQTLEKAIYERTMEGNEKETINLAQMALEERNARGAG